MEVASENFLRVRSGRSQKLRACRGHVLGVIAEDARCVLRDDSSSSSLWAAADIVAKGSGGF